MDKIEIIRSLSVDVKETIAVVFKKMSETGKRLFLVFDDTRFVGLVSIGDIQRAIIGNIPMNSPIGGILRSKFKFATESESDEQIRNEMLANRIEFMPVLDSASRLVKVVFWDDIINERYQVCDEPFDLPVVIMAGGKGVRLRPLTNILPKPLIPINEKTIIEDIMDRFVECGSHRFFLSVNYKADFIKMYFSNLSNSAYYIDYVQESKPLGTAGSLSLLKDKIDSTFFVSNCDIIIKEDYSQILKYHRENRNDLTIVTAVKTLSIPYGIIETTKDGLMKSVSEKPKLNFKINTGMYVLEPSLFGLIDNDKALPITDLMTNVLKEGGRVGCFPVDESSWIDIGNWEEYLKMVNN